MIPVEKQCVVCGARSHRSDWSQVQFPVCDSHSPAEAKAAIVAKQPKVASSGPPSLKPSVGANPITPSPTSVPPANGPDDKAA